MSDQEGIPPYNINTMSIQCRVTSDEKWQLGDH